MASQEQFTPEQSAEAARVIRGTYDPQTGRHPASIFHALNSTAIRSVVELVVLDPVADRILLTKRPQDDPYYSNAWHLPGVIEVRPDIDKGRFNNADDNAAVRGLDELEGTRITSLVPLSPQWLRQDPRISQRGGEAAVFYGAYLIDEEPKVGKMFDVHDLPEPIHEHHPEVIAAAPLAVSLATASLPMIS